MHIINDMLINSIHGFNEWCSRFDGIDVRFHLENYVVDHNWAHEISITGREGGKKGEVDWPIHLAVSGGSGGFGADKEETARRLLFLLPLLALLLLADDGGEDKRGVLVAVQRLRKLTYRLFCLSSVHASPIHLLLRRRWWRRPHASSCQHRARRSRRDPSWTHLRYAIPSSFFFRLTGIYVSIPH